MGPQRDKFGSFGLRYHAPAPDLRRHISSYYIFRADLPFVEDLVRADLGQIRFMIAGEGAYRFFGEPPVTAPAVSLIGPTLAATRFAVRGPVHVLGIGINPAGWAALVREDASALADCVIDARDIFGSLMDDALDAMRFNPDETKILSIVDAVMRVLVARAQEAPAWFTAMTDRWLADAPSPEVDALIRESGMSGRQIERLARRVYGAPPKLLARKYRALRAASLFAAQRLHWADAAGDAFYDQSHFIREFKRFTGQTPQQFQREPTPVTRLTLARRALEGRLPRLTVIS